jgi:hypothetical protein
MTTLQNNTHLKSTPMIDLLHGDAMRLVFARAFRLVRLLARLDSSTEHAHAMSL